ncbi:MAG: helix-turn-helix domain-containing protein [Ghiorsea sp.]
MMNKAQNFYNILNVSADASTLGIVKAYREIKLIFQPDSLAAYSLYSAEELEIINQYIEEAYIVLSNFETRATYDETFKIEKVSNQNKITPSPSTKPETMPPSTMSITMPTIVNGKSLKKVRKSQSITLTQIAEKTNLSKAYLKAIENNDIALFPGRFYLKSYLKQYALSIGLDPSKTWKAYKEQVKD